jgi:protein dithiol oxidoreductase (disulfide-forming)
MVAQLSAGMYPRVVNAARGRRVGFGGECRHPAITRTLNVNRRDFSAALIATGFGAATLPLIASAQGGAPTEGVQFAKVDPPVPPLAPGKIEVLEFFSYACPHCAAFEPTLDAWSKKLPADVVFHRVPAPFLMNADNFMKTYYALETMGQVATMQRKIFTAVHVDRLHLDKPADIAALAGKNGIDAAKFLDVFNSFSVATSVTRAKKLSVAYKLDSVPTMMVNGHYSTSPSQAGGSEQTVAVVDYLIQRARKG